MNRPEATDLAVRILGTFQGPPAGDWEEELADMDAGRAGTTYARLRRNHVRRWLSIAEFIAEYRQVEPHDASTRPTGCPACAGGWVEVLPRIVGETTYHQWQPCSCSEGRNREASAVWRNRMPKEHTP
jgi:hypothetical protein